MGDLDLVESCKSSNRYRGASPTRALKVKRRTSYLICWATGSQWRCCKTGVTCLYFGVHVTILAAAFYTLCSFLGDPIKRTIIGAQFWWHKKSMDQFFWGRSIKERMYSANVSKMEPCSFADLSHLCIYVESLIQVSSNVSHYLTCLHVLRLDADSDLQHRQEIGTQQEKNLYFVLIQFEKVSIHALSQHIVSYSV